MMLSEMSQTQKTQLEMILKEQEVIKHLKITSQLNRYQRRQYYGNQEVKQNLDF